MTPLISLCFHCVPSPINSRYGSKDTIAYRGPWHFRHVGMALGIPRHILRHGESTDVQLYP